MFNFDGSRFIRFGNNAVLKRGFGEEGKKNIWILRAGESLLTVPLFFPQPTRVALSRARIGAFVQRSAKIVMNVTAPALDTMDKTAQHVSLIKAKENNSN